MGYRAIEVLDECPRTHADAFVKVASVHMWNYCLFPRPCGRLHLSTKLKGLGIAEIKHGSVAYFHNLCVTVVMSILSLGKFFNFYLESFTSHLFFSREKRVFVGFLLVDGNYCRYIHQPFALVLFPGYVLFQMPYFSVESLIRNWKSCLPTVMNGYSLLGFSFFSHLTMCTFRSEQRRYYDCGKCWHWRCIEIPLSFSIKPPNNNQES